MFRAKSWPITSLKSRVEKVWRFISTSAFGFKARFLVECWNNLTMSFYVWRMREMNKLMIHALRMRVSLNEIYASNISNWMWKQREMSSKTDLTQGLLRRFQWQLNGLAKVFLSDSAWSWPLLRPKHVVICDNYKYSAVNDSLQYYFLLRQTSPWVKRVEIL
jgi:hypothetical protein